MWKISIDQYTQLSFLGKDGITLKYRLLKPSKIMPGQEYPLVILLHGSNGIGNDNKGQMGFISKQFLLPHIQEKYPCYVAAIQFPSRSCVYTFSPKLKTRVSKPLQPMYTALELIDQLIKNLQTDLHRIYIAGFSMGGSTTWNILEEKSSFFAAAVIISGVPCNRSFTHLLHTPVWMIHGTLDPITPISSSRQLFKTLMKRNENDIRFWEISGLGHFPPSILFESDIFFEWLFDHSREITSVEIKNKPLIPFIITYF